MSSSKSNFLREEGWKYVSYDNIFKYEILYAKRRSFKLNSLDGGKIN